MTKVLLKGKEELSIIISDYWEQSVRGFGSYSKEISESVFKKHKNNNTYTMSDWAYKTEFKKIGSSFFILIKN